MKKYICCATISRYEQDASEESHSSQEQSESAIPLLGGADGDNSYDSVEEEGTVVMMAADGKENQERVGKQYGGDGGGNMPHPFTPSPTALPATEKLGVVKSDNNTRFDSDQDTMTNIPRVAKSRIMAKYARSGKVRRTTDNLGTIHSVPVGNNKTETQSPPQSITSAQSSSALSANGMQQQEAKVSSATKSTAQLTAESLGRKGGAISSVPIGNNKNKAQSPPRSISSAGSSSAVSKNGMQQQESKASSAKESTAQLTV